MTVEIYNHRRKAAEKNVQRRQFVNDLLRGYKILGVRIMLPDYVTEKLKPRLQDARMNDRFGLRLIVKLLLTGAASFLPALIIVAGAHHEDYREICDVVGDKLVCTPPNTDVVDLAALWGIFWSIALVITLIPYVKNKLTDDRTIIYLLAAALISLIVGAVSLTFCELTAKSGVTFAKIAFGLISLATGACLIGATAVYPLLYKIAARN